MARLTPLERAVMDAMAWELRDLAPDLAGQVQDSLPGRRRNTGAGLYSERIVSRNRPPPRTEAQRQATGLFGTVHAMVGDLPDPVGFQVELRQGRLIALHGQSYGQDTRALNLDTAPFGDVFTIDETGRSVLYRPVAAPDVSPPARPQIERPAPVEPARKPTPAPEPPPAPIQTQPPVGPVVLTFAGLYLVAALAALFMIFAARVPLVMVAVFIGWLMRWAHSKKGRPAIADLARTLDQAGVFVAFGRPKAVP